LIDPKEEPWSHLTSVQVSAKVVTKTLDFQIPKQIPVITDLMKRCFLFDPKKRPSFVDITEALDKLCVDSNGINTI
jgi:hypothetical protein